MVVVSGLYDVSGPNVIRFVGRVAGKDRACKLLTRAANLHSTRSGKTIVESRLRLIEPNPRQIIQGCNVSVCVCVCVCVCSACHTLNAVVRGLHGARSSGLPDVIYAVSIGGAAWTRACLLCFARQHLSCESRLRLPT